ncbi:hypothetical protein M8J77_005276 [Diaphorina citri]|nr:hypothetical protein M8J77_005276 [Diaphorina citri]
MNPCASVQSGLGLGSKDGPEKSRTGFYFASFNYVNSILGSGVIGIPYALSKAGFGLGLFLLLVVAVVTDYSLILMVRSGHLSGTYSYQGIMEASFGYPGYVVLSLMQFVYPFIAMVSYNIVVGDTITKVSVRLFSLKATSLFARRDFVVGLATLFITIPLCLFRDLAKLARWSLASLVLVLFILMCILIRLGTIEETVPETEDAWAFADTGMVPAIGIMAFAFMCHHNVFLLYESIEGASQFVWDKLTHISVAVAFVVSLLFGIAGYATFTGNVQGDLLENYCWYDDLMNLARLAFSFTILLTYPIECLVTRSVLLQVLNAYHSTDKQHVGFTLAIVLITYFISITTDCLGVVLELNGVLAAVPLAFILPALSYLKLESGSIFSKQKLPALGLALFGVMVAFVGLIQILYAIQSGSVSKCMHGLAMPYCNKTQLNGTRN